MARKISKLKNAAPPIRIAYQIRRAAEALDESVSHLEQAISDGRLKVVRKKAHGKGRGVTLILAEELARFAVADRPTAQRPAEPPPTQLKADSAKVTWNYARRCVVFDATTLSGERITLTLDDPEAVADSLRKALSLRNRDRQRRAR